MIHDPDSIQQAVGKAPLDRLIQGMAARLRFGQSLGGTLTLPDVSADERSASDHLLGRRPSSGTPLVVRLAEMERILCESGMCDSLAEAVQAIAGPIEDQRRARDSAAHRWTDLFSSIEAAMADLPQYRTCSPGVARTACSRNTTRTIPRSPACFPPPPPSSYPTLPTPQVH